MLDTDNPDNENTEGSTESLGTDFPAQPDIADVTAAAEAVDEPLAEPEPAPVGVPKLRVNVLAKELGITSRAAITRLGELGVVVKSAQSVVDPAAADRLRDALAVPADNAAPAADAPAADAPADAPAEPAAEAPDAPPVVLFQPPAATTPTRRRRPRSTPVAEPDESAEPATVLADPHEVLEAIGVDEEQAPVELVEDVLAEVEVSEEEAREVAAEQATGAARRRRRRGRRGRGGRGPGGAEDGDENDTEGDTGEGGPADTETAEAAADAADGSDEGDEGDDADDTGDTTGAGGSASTKRRRRRRRSGGGGGNGGGNAESEDDPPNTVVHVRPAKQDDGDDGVRAVKGSTRLEAKRQRRRDGRDTSRRRPPILTEAEFLARREAVDRVMAVRQKGDRTQIAVLEDDVLVEHYVTRASATSYVGNVYLGRVQNVLPSMEAAFIDIAKGRNGVLYAGEVNWDAAGLEGKSRNIETALKSGDVVLVQVTKDPIGHKGARLTSQISLPGRFLVYVPGGGMTGISRKLPDTERNRLKSILKKIVPEDAGVIIRTAAEGATEEELTRDVQRLQAQWEQIQEKARKTSAAPLLVHGEPDLAIRVVRDVFNEDFNKLVVQGEGAWATVSEYVEGVAPDLRERVSRHTAESDLFHDLRVDEQLMKALDRKVWLPSGGSLVIDRTEAMTVIDVNTGKFVGTGGNLEQTVTRNNIEAAEEIVRQLRLRDVGGIVVIDFIDMVLESNRELVLRRLTECLGRDRTKHQVAEVTSLGLVQMTRKRVGEGLLEAFSEPCEHCRGRGVIVHTEPVAKSNNSAPSFEDDMPPRSKRKRGGANGAKKAAEAVAELPEEDPEVREKRLAAMAAIHKAAHPEEYDEHGNSLTTEATGSADVAELAEDANQTSDESAVFELAEAEAEAADFQHPAVAAEEPVAQVEPVAEAEPRPEVNGAGTNGVPFTEASTPGTAPRRRRRAASRPAGPPVTSDAG